MALFHTLSWRAFARLSATLVVLVAGMFPARAQFLVRNINTGGGGANSSFPSAFVDLGGTIFFVADSPVRGRELWKSDGTEAGTVLVRDIDPRTNKSGIGDRPELAAVGNTLFFVANDGEHGFELWKSDGTEAGTVMVADIAPGGSSFDVQDIQFLPVGDLLFFGADNGTDGNELWRSDGTSEGTVMVKDIYPGAEGSVLGNFTAMNDLLFFTAIDGQGADGNELWRSDGSGTGTFLVRDILPGDGGSNPSYLTDVHGTLFFAAANGTDGIELWKSDGTSEGTSMIEIFGGPGGSFPERIVDLDGTAYFIADDGEHGDELWKSDGTSSGTMLVADIDSGGGDGLIRALSEIAVFEGSLYFGARDGGPSAVGSLDLELWKSDGTTEGTMLLEDIYPGGSGSGPKSFTISGNNLFFSAKDKVNGAELWALRSDATDVPRSAPSTIEAATLASNYPDPFGSTTTIPFSLAKRGHARLTVHDMSGRVVAVPVDGYLSSGEYAVVVRADSLPSGRYVYRLLFDGSVVARTMVVRR